MSTVYWTEADAAENFVRGVGVGVEQFRDYYGRVVRGDQFGSAEGFVYFIVVGDPITHVKVGFTSGHPAKRLATLQTGCPQRLRLIGFVFGNLTYEQELHDVLSEQRAEGEWFAWTPYTQTIVLDQMNAVYS